MAPRPDEDVLERQAAEALHVDIFPGTEVMRDVGDIHFTHSEGSKDIVYVSNTDFRYTAERSILTYPGSFLILLPTQEIH